MRFCTAFAFLAATVSALANPTRRQDESYVGYLISTFTDDNPTIQFWLSNGNDPSSFTQLNNGQAILTSTVGTGAVRDIFLAHNSARTEFYLLATDLDVEADDFSWDTATRHGSLGIVVWSSSDLVNWSGPNLVTVENSQGGMVWAPSAVWDDSTSQFYVFWSSRLYDSSDTSHTGTANNDRTRYATTTDFTSFSTPQDYYAPTDRPIIDQEFLYLGTEGSWARFFKDETTDYRVFEQITTGGLFGEWTELGYVTSGSTQYEGAATFLDNTVAGRYHILLDNYDEYVPFQTDDVDTVPWTASSYSNFPSGLKHGSVTPVTQTEYDALNAKW